ncbi:L-fuconolactonase [Hamadaea flava]|uniref:Amidohydrolase family protein n=1 Tax=Hamadaea flava TaxID=1742688 RepID=A0ABV8LGB4_9ACTN|nr:amidohydrolase family protein [Hamadaea flava]MCP2324226.1 L-fuconolactonase [Hamadaea flava]
MIDCHVHLWDPADGHPWIRPESPHFRAFTADDLAASGADPVKPADQAADDPAASIDGAILVEASRGDVGETDALRRLWLDHPQIILGYVANLHLHADDGTSRFRDLLRELAETRPHGMRLGGPRWEQTPEAARALIPVLADEDVVLELNLGRDAVRVAADVAARHPQLTVVVDHLGNPANLLTEDASGWQADVTYAARRPNVVMKISGLLTQQRGVPVEKVADLARHVVAEFGPQRCLIGSDWPICLPAGTRTQSLRLAERGLAGLSSADRGSVLRGTAERVYQVASPARGLTTIEPLCFDSTDDR